MPRTPSASGNRASDNSATPEFSRAALAPGLLGAIALLAGLAMLTSEWFIIIRFAAAILALVLAVYAYNAHLLWWLIPTVAIAVVWNPVFPLPLEGQGWQFLQLAGALVFVVAAFMIKVPIDSAGADGKNSSAKNAGPKSSRG